MATESDKVRKAKVVSFFVKELVAAMVNARLYQVGHPRVRESLAQAHGEMKRYHQEFENKPILLTISRDCLVFEGEPLVGVSISAVDFIGALVARGLGEISFSRTTSPDDLQALCSFLASPPRAMDDPDQANHILTESGCRGISLFKDEDVVSKLPVRDVMAKVGEKGSAFSVDLSGGGALGAYQGLISYLQRQGIRVCRGGSVEVALGRKCVEKTLGILEDDAPGLFRMSRYERYDPMSLGHSIGVCLFCLEMARELLPERDQVVRLGLAGLLHDIGNARLPMGLFMSQDNLDQTQWGVMEKHPEYGAEVLALADEFDPWLVAAAFGHHRTVVDDESGYPRTIPCCPVSTVSRLVKVCDIFEALTAPRSYRPALTPLEAYRLMLDMGDELDQQLLKRFIARVGIYPTGYVVMLTTAQEAMVIGQSAAPEYPVVMTDGAGSEPIIALSDEAGSPEIIALIDGEPAGSMT